MNETTSAPATPGVVSPLWVRLLLAFTAILLFAVLVPTLYVRRQSQIEFQQYTTTSQSELRETIAGVIALAYLSDGGTWRNAPIHAATAAEYVGQRLIITDTGGTVVADTAGERVGQTFNGEAGWQRTTINDEAWRGLSVRAEIGFGPGRAAGVFVRPGTNNTYGTLWVESANALVVARDRALLDRLRRVTIVSTGISLVAALIISLILARLIGRPLETLTRAVRRMGAGDLKQRVPEDG
ncbi:MAG: HAMP domain-containing protein, partial [Chloroflexia bacterium]